MSKKENNEAYTLNRKVVFFATGNIHKFNEARSLLSPYGLSVAMLRVKGDEIQSENLRDIACKSLQNAFEQTKLPIFVEDAGLFIDALDGFPGPYAAYVFKTIHNSGVLRLMDGTKNRGATFRSVIVYRDGALKSPISFDGESRGEITQNERKPQADASFGFDPIFQPKGANKSFAEMTIEEKNFYSHRAKAIRKFAEWYKVNRNR
jgi:XTP/dITP diphosphohydrolase